MRWLLDQPVSNSGQLAARLRELGLTLGLFWIAEVVMNPDSVLAETTDVVVASDSEVRPWLRVWYKCYISLAIALINKQEA